MLILDDPSTWPKHIIEKLNTEPVIRLSRSYPSIERIAKNTRLLDIYADVELYAAEHGLAGYHCTKQLSTFSFKNTGLRVLDFQEHHEWSLNEIRKYPNIDDDLYRYIEFNLADYFQG